MNKPRREYYEQRTQFVNLDSPPGFIVSCDDSGPDWYAFGMMDLINESTHETALRMGVVFEYGE